MKAIENTRERYGTVAVSFHWLVALLVVVLLALGLYMARLPDAGFDKKKIVLIIYHKEYGVLVLLLVLARIAWRWRGPLPYLETAPDWQKLAARFVHLWLYASVDRAAGHGMAHVLRFLDPGTLLRAGLPARAPRARRLPLPRVHRDP
jgi:cytochrome b561